MQVDRRGPLGIVLLVYAHVVVVPCEQGLGGRFELNPGVAVHDGVFAELGVVHHDAQVVVAVAAVHRNIDKQVVVAVPDVWNLDVLATEFLRGFVFTVDGVLEKTASLDFPAVVDAAASGQAGETACEKSANAKVCDCG